MLDKFDEIDDDDDVMIRASEQPQAT
jgi:hypothetical protein